MKVNNFDMLNMSKTFSSTGYKSVTSNLTSAAEVSTDKYRKSFDSYLLEAVSKMNDQQIEVDALLIRKVLIFMTLQLQWLKHRCH